MFSGEAPIFQQLAKLISDGIVSELYPEESAVPSAAELAVFHRINPATASKGVNLLVERGLLYKKRGVGMFVAAGAREKIVAIRREELRERFVRPLLVEARVLGMSHDDVRSIIEQEAKQEK